MSRRRRLDWLQLALVLAIPVAAAHIAAESLIRQVRGWRR